MKEKVSSPVAVSILCITYNHEAFLKESLDSMLMQKTNFKYEIVVHDDASTDNTTNILKEYAKKYPEKIIALYEKENQYSKDPHFFIKRMLPYLHGKYIAFCEGDDYWTSADKLQLQFDYMEEHPDCSLCFHNANDLYMNTGKIDDIGYTNIYGKYATPDNDYTANNIQSCIYATGHGIPSASEFYRRRDIVNLPECFYLAPCADFPIELILSHVGYAHYMPVPMSIYRRNAGNSIMDQWAADPEKAIQSSQQFLTFLDAFNQYTNHKYNDSIIALRKPHELKILMAKRKPFKIISSPPMRKTYLHYNGDPLFIKLMFKSIFPNYYQTIRQKIKSKK